MTRGERRISEWDIIIGGTRYKVPVYMLDLTGRSSWQIDESVPKGAKSCFRAEYRDASLRISDVNIDSLRKRVEAHLEIWAQIEWKLCLYIKTRVGSGEIEFDYRWIAVGQRKDDKYVHVDVGAPHGCLPFCEDKSPIHKHHEGVDEETGEWDGFWEAPERGYGSSQEGMPEVGEPEASYDRGARYALVDATPETYRACWTFEKALESLGKQIQARFSPKHVDNTLADITASLPRLPPPKKGES